MAERNQRPVALGGPPRGLSGLRAVLHALRDRLPVAEAAHLGAQLPMLVRGFYYDCWKPAGAPVRINTTQEFCDGGAGELYGRSQRESDAFDRSGDDRSLLACFCERS